MAKKNLFSKAKKAAPAKSAKNEKIRISVKDENFFDNVKKLEELNNELKSAKAKADMISLEIKDVCKSEWVKLYGETGKNPGTVMVDSQDGDDTAQVMFIPQDKYLTIDEERAEELQELYGEDVIEEDTVFSFDAKMIEKYGEILSDLISNCDEIDEDDKEKIIKADTKFSIAKGTIDKLNDYGDVEELVESVRPIVSLKGPEIIKG